MVLVSISLISIEVEHLFWYFWATYFFYSKILAYIFCPIFCHVVYETFFICSRYQNIVGFLCCKYLLWILTFQFLKFNLMERSSWLWCNIILNTSFMASVFGVLFKQCFPTFNVRRIFFYILIFPSSFGKQTPSPLPTACNFKNFKPTDGEVRDMKDILTAKLQ